ncbi:MAG: hypothetical protein KME30_32535 [Iphinoe sp. HA4291-MV1]|nr:hypothetical protein [Iphinoe sp. HA4291-MV1]
MQDALNIAIIAIIAIPAAYAILMLLDFISGLRHFVKPVHASTPSVDECIPTLIELPCPLPPEPTLQVDPWLMAPDEIKTSTTPAPIPTLPVLRLLPPAREQPTTAPHPKRGRPAKKVQAQVQTAAPKRRGRPRKAA